MLKKQFFKNNNLSSIILSSSSSSLFSSSFQRYYSLTRNNNAKILASDNIEKICGEVFRSRGHELIELPGLKKEELITIIKDYDGLVVRSATKVTKDVINAGTNLKIIGRAGTGVDNIDCQYATNKGILVVNTPGGNTVSTAELAVSHILALARNIPQATAALKEGRWDRALYTGSELSGKVIGVIGLGRIGREVAQRCKGFGMITIGYDPLLSESASRKYDVEPVSLDEIFEKSDFITIHTPLTKETKYLIDKVNLAKCKKGVKIINCARGGIIQEDDLLEAVKSGHVGGVSLDTLEIEPPVESSLELRKHPNVIVTPHLGASTIDAQLRVARQVAENMCDILDGGEYRGVVNAPDLSVIHKVPGAKPFVLLCERIGSMHGQLLGTNKVASINISLQGKDIADSRITEVMKSAVLKGVLGVLSAEPVTYVSASSLADELGLQVSVSMSDQNLGSSSVANSISVELEVEGFLNMTRSIRGTVFGQNDIRVTEIDGFSISVPTVGNLLLFNNKDQPGVLKGLVEKVAAAGCNIAHFSLGRKEQSKKAMGALVLDTKLSSDALSELRKNQTVSNVVQLEFESVLDPIFRVKSNNDNGNNNLNIVGINKPTIRPLNPEFSSGPCKKRPGYSLNNLRTEVLGRSHRSSLGKNRLKKAIEDTKRILGLPKDYLCGIVPASDTGAFEMSMWSMLGSRPVDVCYWESFGKGWKDDIVKHLKIPNVREFKADYGYLPNLSETSSDHDILFTYNGTTSGVRVPNLDWINENRKGLTFNDCTSAAFAMDIDWSKTDVSTYSWQKVLGGEGAHGMLILSPRAIERLETFKPDRPLPKIFRMTKTEKDGSVKVDKNIFVGDTINTPSMLCVEDYIDALEWADSIGGLEGLMNKSHKNLAVIQDFVSKNDWITFLAKDSSILSNTSVCLELKLNKDQVKKFVTLLQNENVAYDIGSYRDAPDGLRIWCGATVEESDLIALMPWLKWAYETVSDTTTK